MYFFKIDFMKLSVLVFLLLGTGSITGEYQLVSWISLLFIGTSFIVEALYNFERKKYDEREARRNPDESG